MMTCPFCDSNHRARKLTITKKNVIEHLVVTVDTDNHIHVHGPVKKRAVIERMLRQVAREAGIVVRDRAESEDASSESPES